MLHACTKNHLSEEKKHACTKNHAHDQDTSIKLIGSVRKAIIPKSQWNFLKKNKKLTKCELDQDAQPIQI